MSPFTRILLIMGEEKGEIFRKSLCCEPFSDSDDSASDSDAENHKTTKQGKTEENSVNESTKRRKKESHKKVHPLQQFSYYTMYTPHDNNIRRYDFIRSRSQLNTSAGNRGNPRKFPKNLAITTAYLCGFKNNKNKMKFHFGFFCNR